MFPESVTPNENELVIFARRRKGKKAERLKMSEAVPGFQTQRGIERFSQLIRGKKGEKAKYTLSQIKSELELQIP